MAVEQPTSSNKLNAPDHSLQHRIIAADAAAPVKSIQVDSSGVAKNASGLVYVVNPMDTAGDLIVGGVSGSPGKLAGGATGTVLTGNGAGVAPSYQTPAVSLSLEYWFGDGSDGTVTFNGSTTILGMAPAANVYTMTRDIYLAGATINSGITLRPNGWRIFCTGTITNNGFIDTSGGNGTAGTNASAGNYGTGGPGGTAGASNTVGTIGEGLVGGAGATGGNPGNSGSGSTAADPTFGGKGGNGGGGGQRSDGQSGGGGGAAGAAVTFVPRYIEPNGLVKPGATVYFLHGASAGGGGAGGYGPGGTGVTEGRGGGGGGGGGAAGNILIFAKSIANASGVIRANGGNGANGANGYTGGTGNGGCGGGGGGGGGGGICLCYQTITAGTIQANAGTFGTKGTNVGGAISGTDGIVGTAGNIVRFNATTKAFE